MKLLLLLTAMAVLCLDNRIAAQGEKKIKVIVTGKVLFLGKGVPSASVFVFSSGDSILRSTSVTDSIGVFVISDLTKGEYYFTIESIGYKYFKRKTFMVDGHSSLVPLNDVSIDSSDFKSLQEVVVTSQKHLVEQKIDRLVFNVQNSITASSGTGLEAVGKAPGVRVDQKGISLIGKSSLGVMINDKLVQLSGDDLTAYLRSIPANNIAAIEVITNPPAKYSADGHSGLLNIKLKKSTSEGLNGTVRAAYTQTTYPILDLGATFNYRKEKINVYGNLSYTRGSSAPVENLTIYFPGQVWNQFDHRKDKINSTNYQFGVDYNPGKNTIIGIAYNGSYRLPEVDENIHTSITQAAQITDSLIKTEATTHTQINSNAFNLNYVTKLDKANKIQLNVDADYLIYVNSKQRGFNTQDLYPDGSPTPVGGDNRTLADQLIHISTAKADIAWPLKKSATVSFGSKVSFISSTSNDILQTLGPGGYQVDAGDANTFKYSENTQAIYVNGEQTLGKWSWQLGLRGEYTQLTGNSVTLAEVNKSRYFKLFPTAYLLYDRNDNNSFTLSYGRRIYRPGYGELDPFRWYLNNYQYSEGNPFLQPSFSDNLELAYGFKGRYYLTVYYEGISDYSDQIVLTDTITKITSFLRRNIGNSKNYGLRIHTEDNFFSRWTVTNQVIIYNYAFHSTYDQVSIPSKPSTYFSSTHDMTLDRKKKLSCELTGWYQLPQRSGYDYIKRTYGVNLGLQWLLLEKRLTVSITGNDILKSDKPFIITDALGNYSTSNNYYDQRRVKITAVYKFGSSKIKSKRSRSTGNGDEKNRIG